VLRPEARPFGWDTPSVPSRHLWLPPALEKPRVRTYALGHGISVLGHWVQATALSWLVYRLTDSVFMLGVMGFLTQIPFLLLGPFTGRIVDRMPKLPLLIAIDLAVSAVSVVLAIMAAFEIHNVWIFLAAGVVHGSLSALEMPTRQSLLARIVEDRALMPSALGVSATLFNAGRMVGPALAGAALLYVSEAWCFLFNAASNIGIIAALLAMKLAPEDMRAAKARVQPGVISSLTTLWALPQVKILVPLMAAVGLFGVPYLHLMPSIAREFFGGGSSTFGLLMSAAGLGALVAAAALSMQRGTESQRVLIAIAPAVLGVVLTIFALSRTLALSMALLVGIGACVMCCANSANVLLQQSVGDAWRGRVIGLYAMSFQGLAPVGTLLAGAMAAHIGLSATFLINGLIIGVAGLYARRRLAEHPDLFTGAATDLKNDP
jgi:MFS family permease